MPGTDERCIMSYTLPSTNSGPHASAGAAQARMANSKCASLAFPRLFPRHPEKMVRIATTSLFYSFSPALHDSACCKVQGATPRNRSRLYVYWTPKLCIHTSTAASCGFITDARPTKEKLWKASCAFASPIRPHRSPSRQRFTGRFGKRFIIECQDRLPRKTPQFRCNTTIAL